MKNKELFETMNLLNFKHIPQHGVDAWSKIYKGYVLFVAKSPNGEILLSITIGNLEISLPSLPSKQWLLEFDQENMDIKLLTS